MKGILKRIAIVLGGLVVTILVIGVALYAVGMKKLTRSYPNVAVEVVSVSAGEEAIARGQHLATIWSCTRCHGEDLGGRIITRDPFRGALPIVGSISASNLTSGKGGIGASYSDSDWVRAIRHGMKPDGHAEVLMYAYYSTMSDQDLGDLIAYLKQAPAVDSNLPATSYGPVFPSLSAVGLFAPAAQVISQGTARASEITAGATIEYGRYLAPNCVQCHGSFVASQLRSWTRADFASSFRTGVRPNGQSFGPTMSSKTFTELSDTELEALWLYFADANASK